MNKNLHRVVFNKARGLLMVVGEISAVQGKGHGRVRGRARSRALRIRATTPKPVPTAMLLALGAQGFFSAWAQAQIIADPSAPRSQQPTVLNAPNGVPLVNIQTPSAGGVSRNTYSQFDVQQRGTILNNARTDTQTQLGGWVQGNPWLVQGGARVILNEVNASNPSLLQGYVEVAGNRAQVVIANPAGITCDGCGFINADRATLTTGTPILSGGNLEGYRVQRGTVTVQGAGLDARQTDFTDIIARAVQVNAGIWANALKITTGPNQVSADQTQAIPATGIGPAPGFAIDVGQLGGMYAGKITLVGTETGVGVRNAGQIGASAGEVVVTSDGRLENSGRITSTGNTRLDAQGGLENSGMIYAQGDSTLSTRADIDNSGTIAAQGNTSLSATGAGSRIASTPSAVLGAGVQSDGSLGAQGGLTLDATLAITAQGQNLSAGDQRLAAQTINLSGSQTSAPNLSLEASTGDIDASGATLFASQILSANAGQTLRTDLAHIAAPQINIHAQDLSNRGGEIIQTGVADLTLQLPGRLDNTQGLLGAGGGVRVNAQEIHNVQGRISAGQTLQATAAQALDNRQGTLLANGDITLTADRIHNGQGALGSAQGSIAASATGGSLDNTAGRIQAAQHLTLAGTGLANTDGVLSGQDVRFDSRGQALDNARGTIVVRGTLDIQSGALNNQAGFIGAQGNLSAAGTDIIRNTQGGMLSSAASLTLQGMGLDNRGGQVQALGDITVQAGNGIIDNSASLMRAGQTLAIDAGQVVNTQTQGVDQGIEGQSVHITARDIDNQTGAIRANDTLILIGGGQVNNTQGLISSSDTATLRDANTGGTARTQAISNSGGVLIADRNLTVDSASLTGDGKVLSQGDLSIKLTQNYLHTGQLKANGTSRLETTGTLTNQSALLAGAALHLKAATIDNQANGTIQAPQVKLEATDSHTLINRGLIDGQDTMIATQTLNNLGTGRIYGDQLAIGANTLTNAAEHGVAPVIAARHRLDIGAQTLNNREHALIFSAGDMAIGGSLDACQCATGQGSTLNNNSATIEALGNLAVTARQINNTNEHFSTFVQSLGTESIVEYQGAGSPNRYIPGTPGVYIFNDESDQLMTPEGFYESWLSYNYSRATTETRVQGSDPAQMLSGGAMQITADHLFNDRSRVMAGGSLSGNIGSLDNTEVPGERTMIDSGTVISYWRNHKRGRDDTGSSTAAYNPPTTIQAISLTPTVYQQNTTLAGTGTQVAALSSIDAVSQLPDGASPVTAQLGGQPVITPITQVSVPAGNDTGGPVMVIRTGGVDTSVPNSSLFGINSGPQNGYLVETDPRFTNYRSWLGSDYLLGQLEFDPASTQKRLGDGFYEQRLVREQVAQLTGRRFLDGYASDEAQYRALMDNGATYARAHQLRPGVALSAAQMAALTSDIVWLVEKDVALPDGRSTKALVPQLYVRVQNGDLDGAGALLAGDSVRLQLDRDLVNSGSINGRRVVAMDAENIRNLGGRVKGTDIALNARTDLDNLGGSITAASHLSALAGRDLNIVSTTRTQINPQGSRTNIDRVAGLYVTGGGGTLIASAGRDAKLLGAAVRNNALPAAGQAAGSTTIVAGNHLTLGTVQQASSNRIAWDGNNHRSEASRSDIGTAIEAAGDIQLRAGQDLTARAASVNSEQGALVLSAGRNVSLLAGTATAQVDEAHQHQSRGFLSQKTLSSRDTVDQTRALSSTLSGNITTVLANQDIRVQGSNVVSTQGTVLAAQRDVLIEAASNTTHQVQRRDEQQSGLLGGGSFGVSYGERRVATTQDQTSHSQQDARSLIGSTQGSLDIRAGENAQVQGSDLSAAEDLAISARQIRIQPGDDTAQGRYTQQMQQNGLTLALGGSVVNAVQTVQGMQGAARSSGDSRVKALAAATAALAVANAARDVAQNGLSVNLSLTAGHSESTQTQTNSQHNHSAGRLQAGRDISLSATGDKGSSITVIGSDLRAGRDARLSADHEITLQAAQDREAQHSESHSMSAQAGVAVAASSNGGIAFGATASGSLGRGQSDGDGITQRNTHVDAGRRLSLHSGGDTTLRGAVASSKQVSADVGGDLRIASLQDTARFASRDQHVSASATVGYGANVSASYGQSDLRSDYASVQEQSGIQAGDGGFDITVQGNTDLTGAVIASSQQAIDQHRNRLSTATLSTADIHNHADAQGSSLGLSASASFGGKAGDQTGGKGKGPGGTDLINAGQNGGVSDGKYGVAKAIAGNLLNNGHAARDDASQTRSAISAGAITLSDQDETSLASLNRDTAHAHRAVQEQDVQQLGRDAQVNQAFKQAVFQDGTKISDLVNSAATADKKIILEQCDVSGICNHRQVDIKDIEVGADGKVYVFNHGILNNETQALRNAHEQSTAQANAQGIYVVINPYTGNVIADVVYAGWDKIFAPVFGISNAAQANIDIADQVGKQGGEVEVTGHSRGGITIENFARQMRSDGITHAPIAKVQLNGSAGNAQHIQQDLDPVTNGRAQVWESTHQDDFVGTLIGGNPATGGLKGDAFGAHGSYGPNAIKQRADHYWGVQEKSISMPARTPATLVEDVP